MQNKYDYAAFFDLDKTIIRVNSGEVLVRQAYHTGLMSTKDVLKGIYFSILYKLELKETMKIIEDMASWIAGLSEATFLELTRDIFNKYLLNSIRPEIYKEVEYHKRNNAEIIILSATMPAICKLFANHLDIKHFICSELEIKDGKFTGQSVGRFCFGDEKRIRLEQYCRDNSYDLITTYCYADAFSDFSMLNVVGHPRCINPDKRLRKIALENKWPIFDW